MPSERPDPGDDMRRKFREALGRKRSREGDKNAADRSGETSKVHGAHGPATSRRSFRRKSGG